MEVQHDLTALYWAVFMGFSAACAWIAKSIIKPWSDAYLLRSEAFVKYVEQQGVGMTTLLSETRTQSKSLTNIDAKMTENNANLGEMNSDHKKLCRAEAIAQQAAAMGLSANKVEVLLNRMISLQEQMKDANAKEIERLEAVAEKAAIKECSEDHPDCPIKSLKSPK